MFLYLNLPIITHILKGVRLIGYVSGCVTDQYRSNEIIQICKIDAVTNKTSNASHNSQSTFP